MQTKEQKISPIKQRILHFADTLGISKREFYAKIGVSRGTLESRTGITEDIVAKFIATYPDISTDWLLTGNGAMIKGAEVAPKGAVTQRYQLRTDKIIDQQNVPLYELEATASLVSLFLDNTANIVLGYISIPDMPQCDGAVYVRGDSMYPLLKSGDIVLYKQVKDFQYGVLWGEMYLIAFELDGEEYVTIKYVQKSENSTHVRLVSQNQHHASQEIHINMIRALALVKGSIRYNTMR